MKYKYVVYYHGGYKSVSSYTITKWGAKNRTKSMNKYHITHGDKIYYTWEKLNAPFKMSDKLKEIPTT